MALQFKRKQSVSKGVKRIARRRTEKAFEALRHCEKLEAVHTVRKEIKQLRALLRLTRDAMPRSDYRACSSTLREAASHLSSARDARVKVSALSELTNHFRKKLASHSFSNIKHLLAADCQRAQTELTHAHAVRRVGKLLKAFGRDTSALKLKCSGWQAIGPGLKRSYEDGRDGYRRACKRDRPEDFHEWRKRVKDLFYQMGLLCAVWPEQMGAAETELDALGECLGDAHDLALLIEPRTLKEFGKCSEEETETLSALIEKRQSELHHSALMMGARFYQEKPSVFCDRLHQYWKHWRRERKGVARV